MCSSIHSRSQVSVSISIIAINTLNIWNYAGAQLSTGMKEISILSLCINKIVGVEVNINQVYSLSFLVFLLGSTLTTLISYQEWIDGTQSLLI